MGRCKKDPRRERVEAGVQREAGLALWDNVGGDRYRPKDEQELSDMIARHLRKDLQIPAFGLRQVAQAAQVSRRKFRWMRLLWETLDA